MELLKISKCNQNNRLCFSDFEYNVAFSNISQDLYVSQNRHFHFF